MVKDRIINWFVKPEYADELISRYIASRHTHYRARAVSIKPLGRIVRAKSVKHPGRPEPITTKVGE